MKVGGREGVLFLSTRELLSVFVVFKNTKSLFAFDNGQSRDQVVIDSFADLLNGADVADMALRDIQVTMQC